MSEARSESLPQISPYVGFNRCLILGDLATQELQSFQDTVRSLDKLVVPTSGEHLCTPLITTKHAEFIYDRSGLTDADWNSRMQSTLEQAVAAGHHSDKPAPATLANLVLRGNYVSIDLESEQISAESKFFYTQIGNNTSTSGKVCLRLARVIADKRGVLKYGHLPDLQASFDQYLRGRPVTLAPVQLATHDHWRISQS